MANYETLKQSIDNIDWDNGDNLITGPDVRDCLIALINSLGAGYQFAGVAAESTNPGTPDQNVFYIAGPGTYPNFNNTTIDTQYMGIFCYNQNGWTYSIFQTSTIGFRSSGSGIVQLYDGDTPIFPITKTAAVNTANNTVLENIVKALDLANSSATKGYLFRGVITTNITPDTPEQPVFYIAAPGTYSHFGSSMTVNPGYIGIIKYNGSWSLEQVEVGTADAVRYGAAQDLTDAQRAQARMNIGAANDAELGAIAGGHTTSGKAYLSNGTLQTTNVWFVSTDYTPVKNGDVVIWNPGNAGGSSRCLVIYNSAKERIGAVAANAAAVTFTVSAANAAYIRASFHTDNLDTAKLIVNDIVAWQTAGSLDYAYTLIGNNRADIDLLKPQVAKNSANISGLGGGHIKKGVCYEGANGAERTVADWFVGLDYIPVKQGDTVVWNPGAVPASAGSNAMISYDANKQKVGYFASNSVERTVTIASGVAYIRPSFALSNIKNAKIVVNGATVWKTVDSIGYVSGLVAEQSTQISDLDTRLSSVEDGTIIYDTVENTAIVGIALNSTNTAIMIPETNPQSSATAYIALNAGESVKIIRLTGTGGRFRAGVTTQIPADGVAVTNGKRIDSPTAGAVLFEYTASANCYIVCSTSTANIGALSFEKIISAQDAFNKLEAAIQSDESPEEQIQARFVQSLFANKTNPTKCLSLLHFSDIHDGVTNLQRIVDFRDRWATDIDDVICTGDLVAQSMEDRFIFTNTVVDGSSNILLVIGNHDVAKYDSGYDWYYYAGGQAAYQRYMQNVASWGVTQPSGAGQNNYYPCYYYKDYTDKGVRLIVLDMMDWGKKISDNVADADNPQYAWLQNTLNAARTAGLHVVIAEHFPFWAKTVSTHPQNADIIDSDFSLPGRLSSYISAYDAEIGGQALLTISQMVEDFKTAGGAFACWICGHTHFDNFEKVTANGQKVIVIGTANYTKDTNTIRDAGNESIDLFNIFSVDTINRVVKVFRIGGHLTPALQKIDTMYFTY